MNPRERMLAMIVGALLVLVVGFFLQTWIGGKFTAKSGEIDGLRSKLKNLKQQAFAGDRARAAIAEYQRRSLPPDPALAQSLYQNWLLEQVTKAGVTTPEVKYDTDTKEGNLFVKKKFTITGEATLPQVVDLLHGFYSVDWLHRATNLSLKPIKDSKRLDLTLTVEALSLRAADPEKPFEPRPSQRLDLASREKYHEAIVGRNLFGPANQPPRITVNGSRDAYLGRPAELTIRGTDPDKLDQVSYRLVESDAAGARFDPKSGRFTWTPNELGQYEFTFEGIDDGFPPKPSRQEKVVLNVRDAPPRVETKVAFDHARFTVLTAVLDVSGQGEVWLHVRPTGQTLKLHEGDEFQVGSVQGQVAEIGQTDFTFDSNGTRRVVGKGDLLSQAREVAGAAEAVTDPPAAKAADPELPPAGEAPVVVERLPDGEAE